METNLVLHQSLISILKFDFIFHSGENFTKNDIVGVVGDKEVPISVKYGSQKNTQVHLTTLKSFSLATNMPNDVYLLLEKWLGTTSNTTFLGWLNGRMPTRTQQKYKRLFAIDLDDWHNVTKWFNDNNRKISEILMQSLNNKASAQYLVWIDKHQKTFQIISIEKLIDWIESDCKWVTGPKNGGSTLRCNCGDKPIFHLQMKGSGGYGNEYNHNPQFHIHTNWPEHVIIYKGSC